LYYCIEGDNFKPLHHFFSSLEDSPIEIKEATAIALFDALLNTKNSHVFFENFAQNKYVRNYLLEQLHDPHFRINNYDYAYKLYLNGLNINKDIGEFQDYIFGSCVLFRSYYLKKDFAGAREIGKKLYQQIHSLEENKSRLHIFPFIRYTAYKLWYLNLVGENSIKQFDYGNQLLELCQSLQQKLNRVEQRIVFHTTAEAMVNTSLPYFFHKKLKDIFQDNFNLMPSSIFSKHIKHCLPYFEVNGLLYHRP
jgi:tetratricopeptide (TPR) repeat protein